MNDSATRRRRPTRRRARHPSRLRPAQGGAVSARPRAAAGRGGGRQGAARRRAARARAADRVSAPHPGPGGLPAGGSSAGAGRGAQDPDGGGLRGRDLLCALRRGGRRRAAPAGGDGARLRQPELHAGRRRAAAARRCRREKLPGVRVVRAPCIGSCHTAPAAEVGHHHVDHATPAKLEELAAARRRAPAHAAPIRISTPT